MTERVDPKRYAATHSVAARIAVDTALSVQPSGRDTGGAPSPIEGEELSGASCGR
jgi:hypothetical protein